MPRAISSGLKAAYAKNPSTITACWKATLRDGAVVLATNHTQRIEFPVGSGVFYDSAQGYSISAIENSSDLSFDNMEVDGVLASPSITADDIRSGRWDYAAIEYFEVDYTDLTLGRNLIHDGKLGRVTAKRGPNARGSFTAELMDKTHAYARRIVQLTSQECMNDLGDSRCGVNLAPWTISGTVAHVDDNKTITASGRTEPTDWFTGGKVTFLTGSNAGRSMEVKRYTLTPGVGIFELFEAMPDPITAADTPGPPFPPAGGGDPAPAVPDTFTVYAGCQKRIYEDCKGKFNNVVGPGDGQGFRGFPHLPGVGVFGGPGTTLTPVIAHAPSPGSPPPPAPAPAPAPSAYGPQPAVLAALPAPGAASAPAPTTTDPNGATTLNALLAGAGTTISPSAGIYIISAPVAIPSGKALQPAPGVGVVLKRANGYSGHMVTMTGTTGSAVRNITIDGNVANNASLEGLNTANAISISGGSGNAVENVTFQYTPSYAIWAFNSPGISVRFNDFIECWEPARIDGNNLAGSGNVEGNRATNTAAYKSIQHFDFVNTKSLTVKANTLSGAGTQAPTSHGFEGTWGNSIYIFNSDGYVVENNTVSGNYWSSVVAGQNSTNATIRHNHFEHGTHGGTSGGLQSSWIEQTGADTISFTNNLLVGGLSVGDTGGDHLTLDYNSITVPAGGTGIDCNFAFKHGSIRHNVIKQEGDVHADTGIYLWDKSAPGVDIAVQYNTIEGFDHGIGINNPGGTGTVYGLTVDHNTFVSNNVNVWVPGSLTVDSSCTIDTTSYAPAAGYPFGSRLVAYAAGIRPSDTDANFDTFIKTQYLYWKGAILKNTGTAIGGIPAGSYWPQFSDPSASAVSEGMGYAMLITVVMSGYDAQAQTIFDGLYKFVKAFPCTGTGSYGATVNPTAGANLMSWRIGSDGSDQGGGWPALDGDLDIGLALLMADAQWGSTSGAYNYASEAAARISAMKALAFTNSGNPADGTLMNSQFANGARTSDYMFGHFRAFKAATGDTIWDGAVSKQVSISNYMQATYSPAAGLLPDWIEHVDTSSPAPSSGGIGDGGANPHENAYWYNACRDPWRFGADYVMSGDASVKAILMRMESFFRSDSGGVPTQLVAGYNLDGSHIVGVNPGGYINPEFQGPIMVGAMCDASYQAWLDANWSYMKAHPTTGYYSTEIQLLTAFVVSGNWWKP